MKLRTLLRPPLFQNVVVFFQDVGRSDFTVLFGLSGGLSAVRAALHKALPSRQRGRTASRRVCLCRMLDLSMVSKSPGGRVLRERHD